MSNTVKSAGKAIATRKPTGVATKADADTLAALQASFPVESQSRDPILPRLGLVSQDITEGKGKMMRVITEAGMFFTERQTDEVDENGKKKWEKDEVGTEIDVQILYRRKQLRFYDSSDNSFTSSPVYDEDSEVVPLWKNKGEVARGIPAELQAMKEFQGTSAKGRPMSKLEVNYILYVLIGKEMYQLNIRGTSKFAFQTYCRTVGSPNSVITRLSSESKKNGSIGWNQMTFEVVRDLNGREAEFAIELIDGLKSTINSRKAQFAGEVIEADEVSRKFDKDF